MLQLPEKVRSRLTKHRDEINVIRIPHYASVVFHGLVPSARVLALCRDVIVHDVDKLPVFFRLFVTRQRVFNGHAPKRAGTGGGGHTRLLLLRRPLSGWLSVSRRNIIPPPDRLAHTLLLWLRVLNARLARSGWQLIVVGSLSPYPRPT